MTQSDINSPVTDGTSGQPYQIQHVHRWWIFACPTDMYNSYEQGLAK